MHTVSQIQPDISVVRLKTNKMDNYTRKYTLLIIYSTIMSSVPVYFHEHLLVTDQRECLYLRWYIEIPLGEKCCPVSSTGEGSVN